MKRKIRIGLDFDGVVAYNPFRIIRKPISVFKKRFLRITKLKFFVPKNRWQKIMWVIFHESSFFPGKGVTLLKKMAISNDYEFYLITARFGFLKENLYSWLERNEIKNIFKKIIVNESEQQPHLYKKLIVEKLKLDYFVEDNLDIVNYLDGRVTAKICWIYNFVDKIFYSKPCEFPHLEEALIWINKSVRGN